MTLTKDLAKATVGVDLTGQRTLVCGGTSGIGAGVAERYALAGSSVLIVGRSHERGAAVLRKLQEASSAFEHRSKTKAAVKHAFFSVDLASIDGIKSLVDWIKRETKGEGVDHVFLSQGAPPLGSLQPLANGIEKRFAIQVLSRFGVSHLLTQESLVKRSIFSIAVPGRGGKKALDYEDLDLLKAKASGRIWDGYFWGLTRKRERDSSVIDAFSQVLAERHPELLIGHLYPGIVATDIFYNVGLPNFLASILLSALSPFLATAGPGGYAEVPFFLTTSQAAESYVSLGKANLFTEKLKPLQLSPNVRDNSAREQLYAKLVGYL